MKEGGKLDLIWWNQLDEIRRRDGLAMSKWFYDNLVRVVGDGAITFF